MSQQFKLRKYELEPMKDDRVTVAVECCGVCGSVRAPSPRSAITLSDPFVQQDQHTISGGWGPFETGFVVTGHEVIGTVAELGVRSRSSRSASESVLAHRSEAVGNARLARMTMVRCMRSLH